MHARLPTWTSRADEALISAARVVHLLSACTPTNARAERARMIAAASRGARVTPQWIYPTTASSGVRARLEDLIEALEPLGADPLARIYSDRAKEIACEAELSENVGAEKFGSLAAARFAGDSRSLEKSRALAEAWAREKSSEENETIACDSDHPDSLVSLMKKEIGKRALPFRVHVHAPLSSLAATGDGIIYVTAGRPISKAAAVRTVLHEVDGHALPRMAASKLELAIFRIGTARGTDDQEGLALMIEERAGMLVGERRRDLASRAFAVSAMRNGADFSEIVALMKNDHDCSAEKSVRIAERIFRGSYGRTPGLGRESIYLDAFARVKNHLTRFPDDEKILASGQVSVDAIGVLTPHATP
jgi:hypothetical protein